MDERRLRERKVLLVVVGALLFTWAIFTALWLGWFAFQQVRFWRHVLHH
jgi:hypothetical protein